MRRLFVGLCLGAALAMCGGAGAQQGQSRLYEITKSGKLRVCLEEPNCTSFSTWGFTDRYGSTADTKIYPPRPADSLPWDAALRPKPAYERLLEVLDEV